MKTITHSLDNQFLEGTGATRPEELEMDVRVETLSSRLVLLTFSEPVSTIYLLPEEAQEMGNTLQDLAIDAMPDEEGDC